MSDLSPDLVPSGGTIHGKKGDFVKNPETAERQALACKMRVEGHSLRAIGAALGVSAQRAYQLIDEAMQSVRQEPAEAAVQVERERLDRLERKYNDSLKEYERSLEVYEAALNDPEAIWAPKPLDYNLKLKALAGILRVGESRRKLLGLDTPAKVEVSAAVELNYMINGVRPEALK